MTIFFVDNLDVNQMSALQREVLKSKIPALPPKPSSSSSDAPKSRFSSLVPKHKKKDYTAVSWESYFESHQFVEVGGNKFSVYVNGTTGPVLVLLHGGGHSALSWAVLAKLICSMCECQVVAIDLRGHGATITDDDLNLDINVLATDVASVVNKMFVEALPIVALGHSMGGAVAVHVAHKKLLSLAGLAVIDVVEGTAIDSLSSMQSFLRCRPQSFSGVDKAVEWCIRSGQLHNVESARVSMPGQIQKVDNSSDFRHVDQTLQEENTEEDTEDELKEKAELYTWRVNLGKTESHWKGWFENMSSLFLACSPPKLLVLAGVDRLDKELTIGQMQGKFQMQVLSKCGHMVHEDAPDKVAEIIVGFLVRQRLATVNSNFKRHPPCC